ncbi:MULTISPECIES: hypothetical protein [Legionella]|uniref:Uncharacterized protein n=1 Tax=Legionella resiliens TaxID=2905958 RepID=A0ABS8X069_9GAMM|nr:MULTISPECIES: hypothetical protein [unclassified Legionella]MCE0722995.1 hypothetical protein [Legionella sp. 9fVS26]MCE3532148.1 hypothetical protein [Legionella sp. 8cVS16]QLZ68275.1 hypothetical protein FOLKNPGA_01053 [Legionella sp. PC1000]
MPHHNSIRPEDVLPDGVDSTSINGKIVRKGTIAAFLANVAIFETQDSTEKQKQDAMKAMKELAPGVIAIGLHQHVVFKNREIEQILIDAE